MPDCLTLATGARILRRYDAPAAAPDAAGSPFTARGEALMADARKELAALDAVLEKRVGAVSLERLVDAAGCLVEAIEQGNV